VSGRAPLAQEPAAALDAAEFDAAMATLGPWERSPRIAAAVSGGADSLALALLAGRWAQDRGGSILCLIVDHGLRAESAAEAEQVRDWLAARRFEALILRGLPEADRQGSIQERARALRYRLLVERCVKLGIAHLLLAHHRDDQAETVLMRMVRGSGLRGLAGIAPAALASGSGGRVRLLRPLLGAPKARLRATLQAVGQVWVEDPSNRDLRHERARWRQLMPVLAAGGVEPGRLASAALRLAEDRRALDRAVASWLAASAAPSPYGHVTARMEGFAALDRPIAEAALARILGAVGGAPYPPRRESLSDLVEALRRRPERLGRTLAGCVLTLHKDRLQVTREPSAVRHSCGAGRGSLLWDGRFELQFKGPEAALAGIAVACLGRAGLAEARRRLAGMGLRPPQAPSRQLETLPALWARRALLEVPHIPGFSGCGALAVVAWAPRHPLTG
jgi:tRNA(Ile)-lysidine synthase